jgi:hypothetical protein
MKLDGLSLRLRLYDFACRMEDKFRARDDRHPGEASVTHPDYDWAGESLLDLESHLVDEVGEYFGLDKTTRYAMWEGIRKSRIGRHPDECVDIANLAFLIDNVAVAKRA